MSRAPYKISIVIPALNEEKNVTNTSTEIIKHLEVINPNFEIIFVDDGSKDRMVEVVSELNKKDQRINYVSLSRNFGEQKALLTGINYATGDIVITLDADLQHPPKYIPQMIKAWEEGTDICIMKRSEAGHSNIFKKFCEILFYKTLSAFSDTPIFFRFAGFCLLDRKVVDTIKSFPESDPFLRGLIGYVGFKVTELEYKEEERFIGVSNYSLMKLIKLAIVGFTSFSAFPLYFSFYMGMFAILTSLIYGAFILFEFFFSNNIPQGWTSLIITIIFFGGVQLISMGILGIYLSKIFIETKKRPNFIVKATSLAGR